MDLQSNHLNADNHARRHEGRSTQQQLPGRPAGAQLRTACSAAPRRPRRARVGRGLDHSSGDRAAGAGSQRCAVRRKRWRTARCAAAGVSVAPGARASVAECCPGAARQRCSSMRVSLPNELQQAVAQARGAPRRRPSHAAAQRKRPQPAPAPVTDPPPCAPPALHDRRPPGARAGRRRLVMGRPQRLLGLWQGLQQGREGDA